MRSLISSFTLTLALLMMAAGVAVYDRIYADAKPSVQINVDKAVPHEVDEAVQQAVSRDYSSAWHAMASALAANNPAALNDNFVGFALDKLTQRVKDQQHAGVKVRLIDRGHKVDAIFYSPEGSSIELHDTATLDTEVLDGDTVIHSDRSQVH
jgi:hypothetical protein